MATRVKTRRVISKRRAAAVPTKLVRKSSRVARVGHAVRAGKSAGRIEVKPANHGASNFTKAVRFLNTLSDFERLRIVRYTSQNFDLDRMRTLLKKLGNPQDQFRSVHIAGTKGKGSTAAMVDVMLRANGYKVGCYSSPHLIDIRERIQINGEMISHA